MKKSLKTYIRFESSQSLVLNFNSDVNEIARPGWWRSRQCSFQPFPKNWKPDQYLNGRFENNIPSELRKENETVARILLSHDFQACRDVIFRHNGLTPLGKLSRLPLKIRLMIWAFVCPEISGQTLRYPGR